MKPDDIMDCVVDFLFRVCLSIAALYVVVALVIIVLKILDTGSITH